MGWIQVQVMALSVFPSWMVPLPDHTMSILASPAEEWMAAWVPDPDSWGSDLRDSLPLLIQFWTDLAELVPFFLLPITTKEMGFHPIMDQIIIPSQGKIFLIRSTICLYEFWISAPKISQFCITYVLRKKSILIHWYANCSAEIGFFWRENSNSTF